MVREAFLRLAVSRGVEWRREGLRFGFGFGFGFGLGIGVLLWRLGKREGCIHGNRGGVQ